MQDFDDPLLTPLNAKPDIAPNETERYTQLVNTKTAAHMIGAGVSTLTEWRRRGVGPAYFRFTCGKIPNSDHRIAYSVIDIIEFNKSMRVRAGRLPQTYSGPAYKGRGNGHKTRWGSKGATPDPSPDASD
jgi:hypothetical protein